MSARIDWVTVAAVPGFSYHANVLTSAEELDLVARIEAEARWEQDYERLAQRYGYRYAYDAKTLTRITAIPPWLQAWARMIADRGWMRSPAEQVTVQAYQPGTGIGDHCDDPKCFGPDIATISLLSPCTYRLNRRATQQLHVHTLEPRSIVVLTGEARTAWKHGIPTTKADAIRQRRLSITFRTVNRERIRTGTQ